MHELVWDQPASLVAARGAWLCEVQSSALLGGWAHQREPRWEFVEDILPLRRFRAGSAQINAEIIYIVVPSASLCAYVWGCKIFSFAQNESAFASPTLATKLRSAFISTSANTYVLFVCQFCCPLYAIKLIAEGVSGSETEMDPMLYLNELFATYSNNRRTRPNADIHILKSFIIQWRGRELATFYGLD